MAQIGFTPISLYYSNTAAAVPLAANLTAGELALNTADMKLYAKNSAGTVTLLAASTATSNVSTFSAGTTGFTPSTATSGAVTLAGTLAVANGGTGVTTSTGTGDVVLSTSPTLTTASLTTPTLTGLPYVNGSYRGNITPVSALDIDCSLGNYFTKTINADSTFTVTNVPSSVAYSFVLELTHTSGAVTWFSGVQWPNSEAPSLTAGKVSVFVFVTDDGGTIWHGAANANYPS